MDSFKFGGGARTGGLGGSGACMGARTGLGLGAVENCFCGVACWEAWGVSWIEGGCWDGSLSGAAEAFWAVPSSSGWKDTCPLPAWGALGLKELRLWLSIGASCWDFKEAIIFGLMGMLCSGCSVCKIGLRVLYICYGR